MFFNFIVVILWCVEEDKFGDRSGQTATVWILARCYLPTEADGTLLLFILDTLHTQTIRITSPRAVFLKYVQLYLCISGTLLLLALGSLDRETIWLTRAASSHQPFSHSSLYFFFLS